MRSTRSDPHPVRRLLDPAFGLFVWAAHFLVVYVGAATLCVLGAVGDGVGFRIALVAVTLASLAAVGWHGVRRLGSPAFMARVAVGCDAIAGIGIAFQLFPVLIDPICR